MDNPAYTTHGLSRRVKSDRLDHEWDSIPAAGTCLRCGVAGPDDEECPRRLRDALDGVRRELVAAKKMLNDAWEAADSERNALRERDEARAEVERLRAGWAEDERNLCDSEAEVERLRARPTVHPLAWDVLVATRATLVGNEGEDPNEDWGDEDFEAAYDRLAVARKEWIACSTCLTATGGEVLVPEDDGGDHG